MAEKEKLSDRSKKNSGSSSLPAVDGNSENITFKLWAAKLKNEIKHDKQVKRSGGADWG